jgi:hypothetical protein
MLRIFFLCARNLLESFVSERAREKSWCVDGAKTKKTLSWRRKAVQKGSIEVESGQREKIPREHSQKCRKYKNFNN